MGCEYFYKIGSDKEHFNSYSELLKYIVGLDEKGELNLSGIDDIVYSKSLLKQQQQFDKLKDIKDEYKFQKQEQFSFQSLINGGPSYEGALSIMEFLDTPDCNFNGESIVTRLDVDEYIKHEKERIIKEKGVSEDEASKIIDDIIANWKTIQEDSIALHKSFLSDEVINGDKDDPMPFYQEIKDDLPESLNDIDLVDKLYTGLKRVIGGSYFNHKDSHAMRNLNFKTKIKGTNQDLLCHIDYLFIDSDGRVRVYMFKTSTQSSKDWQTIKWQKYNAHLLFVKQMLASKGIDVKNIELNIVPVQMTYNDDYTKITDINVENANNITINVHGNYKLTDLEKKITPFFDTPVNVPHISIKPIERAYNVCKVIFPDIHFTEEGVAKSALAWIRQAPSTGDNEPLLIKKVGDKGHGYDVIIKGKTYPIKSAKDPKYNTEILKVVQEHIDELQDETGINSHNLAQAVKDSFARGVMLFNNIKGLKSSAVTLEAVLGKYFKYEIIDDEKEFEWEFLDNLIEANVLIFRNKKTGVLDFISISPFDLNAQAHFSKGSNVLGSYKLDSQYIDLNGDYGNIEAIRAMELINEIIPELSDSKLGSFGVLSASAGAHFRRYDIGEFNRKYFQNICQIINTENKDIKIENNFKQATFQNPVDSIIEEYLRIVEDDEDKKNLLDFGFDKLNSSEPKYTQIKALSYIIDQILQQYPQFAKPEYFEKALTSPSTKLVANLFDLVTKAYLNLSGETPSYLTKLSDFDKISFTAATVPDENIRIVVNNLQITYDSIASEFQKTYEKNIRNQFDEFYKDAGYGHFSNMSFGFQARQFDNFFEKDLKTGKNLMIFKNPYDMSNDLQNHERKLLKHVLYQIAYIKSNGNFKYEESDDKGISEFIKSHEEYLWVPLKKASVATSRQSIGAWTTRMRNSFKRFVHLGEAYDEFVNGVTEEERRLLNDDEKFYNLSLTNPFSLSIPTGDDVSLVRQKRQDMINKYGVDYFETNVENLVIDFLAAHISTIQLNKMLIGTKALILQLKLTSNFGGNEEVVNKEIKYIQDYLKVNVFNSSIMEEKSQKIIGVIAPIKHVVTDTLLGGNVVSYFRDLIEGVQQNFIRSLIKLNTDINPSNVAKAYKYVLTHCVQATDTMNINLLNKLCLKYRLSNTDVGRIAERAKSGRNGLVNYENIMYSTLRGSDFINRMTLFVAKCMQDGTWGAWYIDSDNNLKYNWKEDSRFSIFAKGLKDHPEYNKQKSAYLSAIRQYNMDHKDDPIDMDDDLPEPYAFHQIQAIRNVGDNIYGSFDKSKRAMMDNMAVGYTLGMFTTWMNGIVNTYFMKPQKNNVTRYRQVQETNDKGELLYFDKYTNVLTLEEGGDKNCPVLKDVPVIVQGIMYTLKDMAILCQHGGVTAMKKYLAEDPGARANMAKLGSDMLMWMILGMFFKFCAMPAYKDYKKEMPNESIMKNLIIEILYKSSSRSYDQYKGIMNIIQFFGENMNPPYYSVPIQALSEAGQALLGQKSWKYFLFDNLGLTRSIKDSAFAYIKSQS